MRANQQEHPERRGVAIGHRAIEGEATPFGDAARKFEMNEGVVFPIPKAVDEPGREPHNNQSIKRGNEIFD
jgi:hypothetical protein